MDAFRSSKSGEASPTTPGRIYVSVAARVDAGGRGGVDEHPPLLGRAVGARHRRDVLVQLKVSHARCLPRGLLVDICNASQRVRQSRPDPDTDRTPLLVAARRPRKLGMVLEWFARPM